MAVIELYLIRHAIAAERGPAYPDDRLRPLTRDGIARFRTAVRGLNALDVVLDLVLTSPYARARQTADLLVEGLARRPSLEELPALAPGARAADVVEAVARQARRRHRRIALVGHEPDLGELAARLLSATGAVEFKKGGACRIDVQSAMPGGPGVLRWHLPPRVLRRLAR
ncbi:MAG: phosphohistidine phosphatase SixA [Acidobacteriota bacterium]